MAEAKTVAGWIENHLWAILAAAFAAYGGYVSGMMRIDALEDRVAAIETKEKARAAFRFCVIRSLDKLFDRAEVRPECPLEVPE